MCNAGWTHACVDGIQMHAACVFMAWVCNSVTNGADVEYVGWPLLVRVM